MNMGRNSNSGGGGGGGGAGQAFPPSEAIIIRDLPCGGSIAMRIDLNRALENKSERVLIKPNDVVMLRYTLAEQLGNTAMRLLQINYILGSGLRR